MNCSLPSPSPCPPVRALGLLALALVLALLSGCQRLSRDEVLALVAHRRQPEEQIFVLHAGGVTPEGRVGTNSREALDCSYARGGRVMELDFNWTNDGKLVCVHDWDAYYTALDRDGVSSQDFEAARASTYGFTSMTLDSLIPWLAEHPGAVIVTDLKERSLEGAALIARDYPDQLDRFWFQIYHLEDYDAVAALGYPHILLSLYQMSWEEKQDVDRILDFANTHPLTGLVVGTDFIEELDAPVTCFLRLHAPLFVHTVNDPAVQRQLFYLGVTGIYSDFGGEI